MKKKWNVKKLEKLIEQTHKTLADARECGAPSSVIALLVFAEDKVGSAAVQTKLHEGCCATCKAVR